MDDLGIWFTVKQSAYPQLVPALGQPEAVWIGVTMC